MLPTCPDKPHVCKGLGFRGMVQSSWALETRGENLRISCVISHKPINSARTNISEDLKGRWATDISEERKRFYLVATQLDPRTKMLSFCGNKYAGPCLYKRD